MQELLASRKEADSAHGSCCVSGNKEKNFAPSLSTLDLPMAKAGAEDAVCCGPKPGPPSSPFEKPGYRMWHFVSGFNKTPIGAVPRIETTLKFTDFAGSS